MKNELLMQIIREAAEKNREELDLSGKGLTFVPSEIGILKNLTRLDLSSNQLTALPPQIAELKKLTKLDVSRNQLSSLPTGIGELENLERFLASANLLTFLPPEISNLQNLTKLDVSDNQLSSLPTEIKKLEKLTGLILFQNNFELFPLEITFLKNLTGLFISENMLTFIPPEISRLKKLTAFFVFKNKLKCLPNEIKELCHLAKLDISDNQLDYFPCEIFELNRLNTLDISKNRISSLPLEIMKLNKLLKFHISNNQLTSLPDEISLLENLEELDVSENRLISIPENIQKLKNLKIFNGASNQITSIPQGIIELKRLTKINLAENNLTFIPIEILELELEIELRDQSLNNTICLKGNPLEIPPLEIVKKGRGELINYFKSLEGGVESLNEVKVLLVGEGGAGKTSLVKRLVGEKFDDYETQTHGINVRKWKVKQQDRNIKVNFWDFGGQEIMHATHQFFLSKRSLYILVLDARKDEKTEYWLKHIESFGGNSPVLVVINKIDENPGFDVNRKFLQEKYRNIRHFYRVSCKENENIEEFSKSMREELLKVEHLRIYWPKSWFNVRNRLESMTENFISYSKYKQICKEEEIKDRPSQNTLVGFLNDLGVIVHFKDIQLLDTHVLEPKWITEAVYKVINSKELAESSGVLEFYNLDDILRQENETDFYYPPDRYYYIISLMKKFELCYEIDSHTVLVPDLLEIQEPEFYFDYASALKFIVEYDFLPRSIMPRPIVKMNKDIKQNLRWRTGIVLEDKAFKSSAVVKADNDAKKIYIYVTGEQRRDYFSVILFNLRELNHSFEKLKFKEKVPLPDDPLVTVGYDHLITLEKEGEDRFIPEGSDKRYYVNDLLGTIHKKKVSEEELQQILKKVEEQPADKENFIDLMKDVITLNPNFYGIGIDLKKLLQARRK